MVAVVPCLVESVDFLLDGVEIKIQGRGQGPLQGVLLLFGGQGGRARGERALGADDGGHGAAVAGQDQPLLQEALGLLGEQILRYHDYLVWGAIAVVVLLLHSCCHFECAKIFTTLQTLLKSVFLTKTVSL